jgi:Domain of unknown function (DUF4412)
MKAFLCGFLALFAVTGVRADLVIEQKIESQVMNGNMNMKIKGEKARMDIPSPVGGNMTILMDLANDQMATLVHAQKMVMKMKMADAKKAAEEQQKKSGVDVTKVEQPKATGQKEKIGEWNCEIYDVNFGGMTGKMWVTKDFPNYKSIMEQMNKINSAASMGMGMDPSKFQLDGMTVKTEMAAPFGKMTSTLVKVTEGAVPDSEFEVPAGYKEMSVPGLSK